MYQQLHTAKNRVILALAWLSQLQSTLFFRTKTTVGGLQCAGVCQNYYQKAPHPGGCRAYIPGHYMQLCSFTHLRLSSQWMTGRK